MLRIEILGTPNFERDGAAVVADTRKAGALLAYLTVEGPASRETLAALLWPESDDSRARATLRRTLSAIRSAMGEDVIEADRQQIRLGPMVRTDVADLNALLGATDDHDHADADVCKECIPLLSDAVRLYRGDFLAGFTVRDSIEFEDWLRITAESLRMEIGGAYERLAAAQAGNGDVGGAIRSVNSWLELDPLREPAFRLLMLLNAWAGDIAGATDAYRRCVAALNRELGVDPLEETTELYGAILDDDLPPAPAMRRQVRSKPLPPEEPRGDMIDREAELAALLESVRRPRPGHVTSLIGDAWMGKSRLLEETRSECARAGIPVISARGYRSERQLPYGVVSQMVASLISTPAWSQIRSETPGWVLSEVTRVHPGVGEMRDAVTDDPFGETRLHDALFHLLTMVPGTILVDDAQWCDQSSLSVLGFMANRIASSGAVLVLAHRPVTDAAYVVLAEIERSADSASIELSPLTSGQIAGLTQLPDEVIERTGGIPALVVEAISEKTAATVTPGVRLFMEARLADIDDLTRQILTAASALSGTCDVELLRETSGRTDDEVVVATETLIERRILETSDDGGLEFHLDSMERLVYEDISLFRRRLLHRRAASALEHRPRASTDASLATSIAWHHLEGGSDREAAEWYLRAGDLSLAIFATTEAIDSYRSALALGHPDASRIHIEIGNALLFMGRYSESISEFEKAAAFGAGSDLARAEHKLGEANRRLGRLDVALSHFEAAEGEHPSPVNLYCDWSLALLRTGDGEGALSRAEQAVAAAADDDREKSRALAVLGIVGADPAGSRQSLLAALELAGDDPVLRMAALNALGHDASAVDKTEEAIAYVEEALDIAASIGDRHRGAALYNHLADLHHRSGDRARAEVYLTEAVKLFVEVEPGSWEPEVWLLTQW